MGSQETKSFSTIVVLSNKKVDERTHSALCAAASALGHEVSPVFVATGDLNYQTLGTLVHELDPWSIVIIDEFSLRAAKGAFSGELSNLTPDCPWTTRGYQFVLVPEFSECFDDPVKKRTAWERLKAAHYPSPPL